jgi:HemK-like putative methylase
MDSEWLLRDKYRGEESAAYRRDLLRLEKGEHIDYIIGFSNFLGSEIDLSQHPLIPRPETEHWAEKIIATMPSTPIRALDLFTGSGCIGIAVLKHKPKTKVDFADIEPKYFKGIRKSLRRNKIYPKRARLIKSNIFSAIKEKYDYILTNPPYIPTSGRKVQKSVLEQEPHTALFGGKDGLKLIRKLIKEAKKYLNPGGTLVVEFDPPQKTKIAALARQFSYDLQFFKDQYKRTRYVVLKVKVQARSRSLA